MRLVKDTNVFVAALRSGAGASRRLLRLLLARKHCPLISDKLWLEYLDVTGRAHLWTDSDLSAQQRSEALDDFAAACEYVTISRLWRPNLPDEGDNHVMELAICGNAAALVTFNKSDFTGAMFAPPGLLVLSPSEFLNSYPV